MDNARARLAELDAVAAFAPEEQVGQQESAHRQPITQVSHGEKDGKDDGYAIDDGVKDDLEFWPPSPIVNHDPTCRKAKKIQNLRQPIFRWIERTPIPTI